MKIIEKARAKINLFLDVIERRFDGYHTVNMVLKDIGLYDSVELYDEPSGISLEASTTIIPLDESNLAYKAARLFCDYFHIHRGVNIYIDKRIPVAAGLAGGSTDAAAVLRGLNKLWNIKASVEELKALALKIGADVPFCIEGGMAMAKGIGEHLTYLPSISDVWLLLAVPSILVSTAWAYNQWDRLAVKPHMPLEPLIDALYCNDPVKMGKFLFNALEVVTIKAHPIINDIKVVMKDFGCLGSCMSGSGPAVFGIFDDFKLAQKAADKIADMIGDNAVFVLQF